MKLLLALLALSLSAEIAAQQMFKCKNAAGKITYSSQDCKEIGLSSAGEIKGEISVTPAYKRPPPPPPVTPVAPVSPRPAAKIETPPAQSAASTDDVANPNRRCFTFKTAKGTSTRCNDKPEETEQK